MIMKKGLAFLCCVFVCLGFLSCKKADNNNVIIFTSTEDFRTEHMQELLKEKFPNYNITLQVLSTGNHAAKLKAEGTDTEADIILNLETGYLEGLTGVLADLSSFGYAEFLPELVPEHHRYLPWDKSSGAIVLNRDKLGELGLPAPETYEDLLKPIYKMSDSYSYS
jgi:iron(III) transport system substrate-binding protein